jgi:hypothetical protein
VCAARKIALFAIEEVVDRAPGDAGAFDDILHSGAVVALGESLGGGDEDTAALVEGHRARRPATKGAREGASSLGGHGHGTAWHRLEIPLLPSETSRPL